MYNQIIFVSEMRCPSKNASSTQIMTRNLLFGFNKISQDIIFVPIVDSAKESEEIFHFYKKYCNKIVFVKALTHFKTKPFRSKISMLFSVLFKRTIHLPKALKQAISDNSIVVSHSPSIDSVLICETIKRKVSNVRYVQYWGDPISLSLITPEQYSYKRSIQKFVEKKLHRKADKIVFGTKSLFDGQMKLFPEIREKSTFVEVSYSPDCQDCSQKHEIPIVGYFGNYFSNIRDIIPFYNAACKMENVDFVICGSSNIYLEEKNNIKILTRVPQIKVNEIEREIDISICILNKKGIQIPGKIFYQTNTSKDILVILDGPNKNEIKKELSMSNRFYFAENNIESIYEALEIIINKGNRIEYDKEFYSPERICLEILK